MEVLVTGGDTELGRTVAECFRDAGHRVVIAGSLRDDLEIAAKELDVDAIVFDNTDPASLEEARALFPHHLDTIINVPAPRAEAGDPRTYSLADLAAAWRNALDAAAVSAVLTVQILGDHLRSGGSIVNVIPESPAKEAPRPQSRPRVSDWTAGQATHFGTRGSPSTRWPPGAVPNPDTTACWHTAVGGRGDRSAGAVPHHACRAAHHRADAACKSRRAGQLRLSRFPRSPQAKRGDRPAYQWLRETVTIRLGLQIPNFSYGTGVAELFPTVIAQAQEAEAAGYDSVFVMDHFYQLPGLGTPTSRCWRPIRRSAGWRPRPSACSSARSSRVTPTATRPCWPRPSPRWTW